MPLTGVQGYTSQTQQTRLCLETSTTPGEQLLMPEATGAATMSLTTQPNTISATTGMHLHVFIIGNPTDGSVVITGTDIASGALVSITYNVLAAPQNAQGYREFTTKEAFRTVSAGGIALTTLTPCRVIVFGSFAAKHLLPIVTEKKETFEKHSSEDKRGILWKHFRVTQSMKKVEVGKLDSNLYPGSLWAFYMAIGKVPVTTTVPSSPSSFLAATTRAATMTLTTGLSTVAPGMFLIFTIANSNVATGTIVLSGLDNYGVAVSETIAVPATDGVVYSTRRYSALTSPGTNQFATTGLTTGATIAVTGVFAWKRTWTYDGVTNVTPYSGALEVFDGVEGVVLPGTILTDFGLEWEKEKPIMLTSKGEAQDYLIVGDPASTTVGTNPFATLAQPTDMPMVSWPASHYIDLATGTPGTTQDGSLLSYKFNIATGRKWNPAGDGFQRPSFVLVDDAPEWTLDAEIIYQNYQLYVKHFKPNVALILHTAFQGNWLGSISSTTYWESVEITLPAKIDEFEIDQSSNPVKGKLKLMSEYSLGILNFAYKIAVTSQTPPTYES
jgi:hypothetical protein